MKEAIRRLMMRLKDKDNMCLKDPASCYEIKCFEETAGVHLPSAYRIWLELSDGGELYLPGGIQLYGITHKPLIDIDCCDRPNDGYILIGALASGDPILCKKGSEEISIYNQDAGRIEEDEVFEDFYDLLSKLETVLGIEG